jgi:hypothetical protein
MSEHAEHERQLIRAFILPARQDRYLELLAKPQRRTDITDALAHFKHLNPRYVVKIPPHRQHTAEILKLLQMKGAPKTCYAISEDQQLDGKEIPLKDALHFIVGRGIGTILSCIAGRLGYFEDEEDRWVLERQPRT